MYFSNHLLYILSVENMRDANSSIVAIPMDGTMKMVISRMGGSNRFITSKRDDRIIPIVAEITTYKVPIVFLNTYHPYTLTILTILRKSFKLFSSCLFNNHT